MGEEVAAEDVVAHGDGCACTRCVGFQPGHQLSVRHGAYASSLRMSARVAEIADELRAAMPLYSVADEAPTRLLAFVLSRIERAMVALEAIDDVAEGRELLAYVGDRAVSLQRLREDARGWVNTARRLCGDLGLTPTSRAKLGLDLSRTNDELARYLEQRGRGDAPEVSDGA